MAQSISPLMAQSISLMAQSISPRPPPRLLGLGFPAKSISPRPPPCLLGLGFPAQSSGNRRLPAQTGVSQPKPPLGECDGAHAKRQNGDGAVRGPPGAPLCVGATRCTKLEGGRGNSPALLGTSC